MTDQPPNPDSRDALRNVIGAAIWRRVTRDDGNWSDKLPTEREEFLGDADAVLAALVAEGYSLPSPTAVPGRDPDESTATAIDTLARESACRLVLTTGGVQWDDYPGIGEQDWGSVVERVMERAESDRPDSVAVLDAYEYLSSRAEAPGRSRAS